MATDNQTTVLSEQDIQTLISPITNVDALQKFCAVADYSDLVALASSLKTSVNDIQAQLGIVHEDQTVEWADKAAAAKKWVERKLAVVKQRLTEIQSDRRIDSLVVKAARNKAFVEAAQHLLDRPTIQRIWSRVGHLEAEECQKQTDA